MTAPVLYSFRRCPYAMRARMALAVSGARVRLREILLRDKPDDMIAISEKGTVPVLRLEDGGVIDESLDVMRWALAHHDPEHWLPNDKATLDEMLTLIAENDGPFKHHLDRYKYSTRYEGADKQEHRAAGEAFLSKLNARLQRTSFLFGASRTLADIAIFPFVRQFRIADPDWFDERDWPELKAWLDELMKADLFASIMEKYPLWKESHKEHMFP